MILVRDIHKKSIIFIFIYTNYYSLFKMIGIFYFFVLICMYDESILIENTMFYDLFIFILNKRCGDVKRTNKYR